jgi:Ca-activated chloride channel homolog
MILLMVLPCFSYLARAPGTLSAAERENTRGSMHSLKVDVDLVLLNASVTGPRHHVITGLEAQRFHIFEDGVEQKIVYFNHEEVPASIGIVLDVSGSMLGTIAFAKSAVATFLKTSSRKDEYFLVTFSDSPRLEKDFTSNSSEVAGGISFKIAGGSTSLYDAVYLALAKMTYARQERKAIVVVTDGSDNNSQYTLEQVCDAIKESNVEIYPVGILGLGSDDEGIIILKEIAQLSGGKAYFPRFADQLEDICTKIALEIKNQYVLGYYSSNKNRNKSWRKIKLRLAVPPGSPRLSVRTKPGYYARTSQ